MSQNVTRKEIANALLVSLKDVVAKRKGQLEILAKKEQEGKEKLNKSLPKDPNGGVVKNELNADNGVLPGMDKALVPDGAGPVGVGAPMAASDSGASQAKPMCLECGGSDLEPLGSHMGMNHTICKTCGDVNAEGLNKATPSDISESTMHKLKAQYHGDKSKAYATAWAIHNKHRRKKTDEVKKADSEWEYHKEKAKVFNEKSKAIKDRINPDPVKKAEMTVDKARQAVGGVGAKTTGATVNKPTAPGATKVPDAFATGGDPKLGKAEKTPFNDGAGTSGKPHEEIPGTDVAVDKARKGTEAPKAGKVIDAKGSGGDIKTTKLAKDEGGLATMERNAAAKMNPVVAAPKPGVVNNMPQRAGVVPTAREALNAKQGVTSLATIRQRWHANGNRDANDIARALKPAVQNAPALNQAANNLQGNLQGLPKTSMPGAPMKIAQNPQGQLEPSGTGNRAGIAVIKSEGIPAAPKAPGASKGGSLPAAAPAKTPTPNISKL